MDLTMTQSVNSIFLLSGSLFCLIAALSFWWGKNFEKRTRRWMICMQLSASLLLCSNAAAYIFRGRPDRIGYWAVRVSNFLVFFALDVTLAEGGRPDVSEKRENETGLTGMPEKDCFAVHSFSFCQWTIWLKNLAETKQAAKTELHNLLKIRIILQLPCSCRLSGL